MGVSNTHETGTLTSRWFWYEDCFLRLLQLAAGAEMAGSQSHFALRVCDCNTAKSDLDRQLRTRDVDIMFAPVSVTMAIRAAPLTNQ
jgi:hypothetical protein